MPQNIHHNTNYKTITHTILHLRLILTIIISDWLQIVLQKSIVSSLLTSCKGKRHPTVLKATQHNTTQHNPPMTRMVKFCHMTEGNSY